MSLRAALALTILLSISTVPLAAQTLSAQPASVIINYTIGTPAPEPVEVEITTSNSTSPVLTATVIAPSSLPPGLFHATVSGPDLSVAVDRGVLSSLLITPAIFTATVQVTATGFLTLNVPVTLDIGGLALGVQASPTTLIFNLLMGSSSQTVTVTAGSNTAVGFTAAATTTSGGTWLSVTANQQYTPATLTVAANPGSLTPGTYAGSITITPDSGGVITIAVTLQAGPSAPLTVSPTALSFGYNLYAPAPPAQLVHLTSNVSNNTYTAHAYSTGSWLLVNGGVQTSSATLPADLSVTVNPFALSGGAYQGSITVVAGNGRTQQIVVNLTVYGVISAIANPTALSFVAQAGAAPPAPQFVYVPGASNGTYTANVQSGLPWLSISSGGGHTPVQLGVVVTPGSLVAGTYFGTVSVANGGRVQSIQVSLVISASPVLLSNTGAFMINYLGGNSLPAPLAVSVFASGGPHQSFTLGAGLPSWLQVTPAATYNTPAGLVFTVNPTTLPSGTYLSDIVLNPSSAGSPPVSIPVLLNVTGVLSVMSSAPSLTFNVAAGAPPQTQTISATALQPLMFTATTTTVSGGNWLAVTPSSGAATGTNTPLSVTAAPQSLAAGNYQGTVFLTTSTGIITQVPVTLSVGAPGVLSLSASSLSFDYTQGTSLPANQTVQVLGSGTFTAAATSADKCQWLSVTPASGSGGSTITVAANPASCAPGTGTGTVTVTPTGGTPQIIAVTLTVTQGLSISPGTVAFTYRMLDAAPAAQTLNVTTSGPALNFTIAASSSGWLSYSAPSGTTPAALTITVDPTHLTVGDYTGTVTFSSSGEAPQIVNVTLSVTSPPPVLDSVVNAASYAPGGVSPGEIVAIFGDNIGPTAGTGPTVSSTGIIGPILANTQVTFNGHPAPIVYAGIKQVNAVVPYEIAGASDVSVIVTYGKATSNTLTLPVVASTPAIFSADSSGVGPGAILDMKNYLVNAANPVSRGAAIMIFATGAGQTNPNGVNGQVAGSLPLPAPQLPAGLLIGNQPARILYVGGAPGLVAGVLQVNAVIPDSVSSGAVPIVLSIGSYSSQPGLTVTVQ